MYCIHLELSEANDYVTAFHRHHFPATGHKFSIGAVKCFDLVGVAIVGRPTARNTCQRTVVEVVRLCTDGTHNACSFLYGQAARAAAVLGYRRIQTFILASEPGTTLKAVGWVRGHMTAGGSWNRPSRKGRREDQPQEPKVLWYKDFE